MATGEGLKVCTCQRKQLPATGDSGGGGVVEVEVVEVEVEVGPDITKWARAVVKPYMLKPGVVLL